MSHFSNRMVLGVAFAALAAAPPASAQNSTVRIYESAFDKFAAMIQPLQFRQRYALRFTIRTFWGSRETITLCDATVVANIMNVQFDIAPSGITIRGMGIGSWCGLAIIAPQVSLSATATYSASSRTVRMNVSTVRVSPQVLVPIPLWAQVLGLPSVMVVGLPQFTVGAAFAIPPIPVDSGLLHVEAPAGPIALPVGMRNVQLLTRNGYLELRGNVQAR
jgi:hypothetical protein